jgi:hypothetical protein
MIRQRVGLSDITGRQNGGAGQKGPVTHVGANSALPALARLTRPLRIGLADAWDVLRAQRKIRRGF